MQLSERFVEHAKPARSVKMISDGGTGLHLKIEPTGTKTYLWRWRVGTTWKKLTIGRTNTMKVEDARTIALGYTNAVKHGRDPHLEVKVERDTVKLTSQQAWAIFDKQHVEKKKPRTAKEYRRIWDKDIEPVIGSTVLQSLTGADLRRLVSGVGQRSEGAARLSYSLLSAFLAWAHEEGHIEANPLPKKSFRTRVRERHLHEHEIVWVLRACRELRTHKGKRGSLAVARWATIVEILLRTGQRDSNISNMTTASIINDTLVVRSAHFKGNRVHELPLPEQVLKLLKAVDRDAKKNQRIFQGISQKERSLDVIRAKVEEIAGGEVEHWSLHSLRKTFATVMAEMWDEELDRPVADHQGIEAVLGHSLKGVTKHYNFSRMLREKKRLMIAWNSYLDGLVGA